MKVTDTIAKTDFAVKPKELSPAVKKGLEYLVKSQQEDGGWNQGGGWRTRHGAAAASRARRSKTRRTSATPASRCWPSPGRQHRDRGRVQGRVKKGLKFVIAKIEKADKDSLYVTDVKGTQLQSKIGPYVDTFLANLVLAELRGKSGDQEKRLVAALEKTMTKIVRAPDGRRRVRRQRRLGPDAVGRDREQGHRPGAAERRARWTSKVAGRGSMAQAKGAATGTAPAGGHRRRAAARAPAAADGPGAARRRSDRRRRLGGHRPATRASRSTASARAPATTRTSQQPPLRRREGQAGAQGRRRPPKDDKDEGREEARRAEEGRGRERQGAGATSPRTCATTTFVAGFGSNGGEEFLSFMNISETLVLKGGKDWDDWDAKMVKGWRRPRTRTAAGPGHHCITGKTFCTAGGLLVLMADRTPFPVEVLNSGTKTPEKPVAAGGPREEINEVGAAAASRTFRFATPLSFQEVGDHVPVHVGQPAVDAVVPHGQLRVVDAEQVQDRRVDVVHLASGSCGRPACSRTRRSGRSVMPPFTPPPHEPVREAVRVVVAALAALRTDGIRPNSVVHRTMVSSSRPRRLRSAMSAAAPRAMPYGERAVVALHVLVASPSCGAGSRCRCRSRSARTARRVRAAAGRRGTSARSSRSPRRVDLLVERALARGRGRRA